MCWFYLLYRLYGNMGGGMMLIYDDDLKFFPEVAGIYPIVLPVDCSSMQLFLYQDYITNLKSKFQRVYKSDNVWNVDVHKTYNVRLPWDSSNRALPESVDATFCIVPNIPTRWYSYKPVVCADVIKYGDGEATIRIRLNGGSTVDFTSHSRYFANKVRDCLCRCMPYEVSATNGLDMYGPDMPLERREQLRQLLPNSSKIQNLDWIPNWHDVRYDIAPYCPSGTVDHLALFEAGFIPALAKCNHSKPFAKGSSFAMKITPGMFCLLKDVNMNNMQLVKFLESAGSKNLERDLDIITTAVRDRYGRHECFGVGCVDNYGSYICCIGTCYIKAVSAEKVIERYTKQDELL